MTGTLKSLPLILALAAGCLAAPLAARDPQNAGKPWRIGVLLAINSPDGASPQAFRQGLRDLGYVEGQNLVIDWRYQLGGIDRLPALAEELVRLKPDVIVADTSVAIRAAMQVTKAIPIVMTGSADAVASGLVTNLRRPGGNVTGVTIMLAESSAKRLQLLKEAAPRISRVAVLWDPQLPWHPAMLKEVEAVAPSMQLQSIPIAVRNRGDFGNAFSEIASVHADAVFVSETMTADARRQLFSFAAKNRLPAMYVSGDHVAAGGLISYAPNFAAMSRHAAQYVDRILKGARPGDLPVEQPTEFELVVNLKTAKALGIKIPQSLLSRATKVFE